MPFRSKAQARLMWARHPGIARKWANESRKKHPIRNLPEHKRKRKR